jgi:hypothetical protein
MRMARTFSELKAGIEESRLKLPREIKRGSAWLCHKQTC